MHSEGHLKRVLGGTQLSLIAMGGAIGTGLFMGSGFAISLAGPSVLISFAIGALIALLMMACLAEMTVVDPQAGSFGRMAETYLSPLAGVLVSYAYLSANILAIGMEGTAIALCMKLWFPAVPGWWWILASSITLVLINLATVRAFAIVESSFASIKIVAIVLFIVLGTIYVATAPAGTGVGIANYTAAGGFFPHGLSGTWMAVVIALLSFGGVEVIAVAAGEARDPRKAIVQALRMTFVRLALFYLITIAIILAIAPWTMVGSKVSPFVTVMSHAGLKRAADLLNFLVLVAASSAMNSQLYASSRMAFSLADAGHAPSWFAVVNSRGVPARALMLASVGMMLAGGIYAAYPEDALEMLIALSVFGLLFTWLMIFVSHFSFRTKFKADELPFRIRGFPYFTLLGAGLISAVTITTLFMPAFRLAVICGVPFLALVAVLYFAFNRAGAQSLPDADMPSGVASVEIIS